MPAGVPHVTPGLRRHGCRPLSKIGYSNLRAPMEVFSFSCRCVALKNRKCMTSRSPRPKKWPPPLGEGGFHLSPTLSAHHMALYLFQL